MVANILDPSALLSALPGLLGTESPLGSPQDALAALLHTVMAALSFRLVGLDSNTDNLQIEGGKLPNQWNANGPSHYSFKYRHEQSSLEFLLNLTKLGDRTLINALAVGSDKIGSLDIKTADYTSESFFPFTAGSEKPLVHGFISSSRVSDFVSALKIKIISNIMPGLQKVGYQESSASEAQSGPTLGRDQTRPPQHVPQPPAIGPDPLRAYMPDRGNRNPLEIGRRDLDPIPLGGTPFAPPSLFPGGGGDGMFVGPDHPIFAGRNPRGQGSTPWGGDGYLPPMGAPPGARFDPVMPGMGGLPRGPGEPRGGFRNYGDPDNDELPPPGSRDMFM